MPGSMEEETSSRTHLPEATPAQLVLDGAQEVVRLVGDREVGVTCDPEVVVAQDLHPGEERVEGVAR